MWRISGAVVAAVLLGLVALAAASPGPYAGFALDDIRRPVYRGNMRYNRNINSFDRHTGNGLSFLGIHLNGHGRLRRDTNSGLMKSVKDPLTNNRNVKEISPVKSINYNNDENWSLISLATSISDHNQTKSLVTNFLTKSLQNLQTTPIFSSIKSANTQHGESLDSLILSHTQHGSKPIQMYPEGSPPTWQSNHHNPAVILIEDVHPSKLPKPNEVSHQSQQNTHYKPVQLLSKPTVVKPISPEWGPVKGHTRPSETLHHYSDKWDQSIIYKPPYIPVRPTRPIYYDPDAPLTQEPPEVPVYKPVHTFPSPTKPPHNSPRPPEEHYKDPPNVHNSTYFSSIIQSQASVYPISKPTVRPPAPTIIVLDSVTDAPPPPSHNCGTVQVINNLSKEPYKGDCSDVLVLINSPTVHSISSSAAASVGSGAAVGAGVGGSSAASVAAGVAGVGAAAAAAAAGVAGSVGSVATVGGGAGGVATDPHYPVTPVTPVLHPVLEDDEDYDYDDSSSTTSSTTMKPTTMSPSNSHVLTFFDYMIAFLNTLPILGPVSVSIWIILLGPLAFIMVGLLGVGTFLLPWIGPRIIFGRRRRRRRRNTHSNYPIISDSAEKFERNLKMGLFKYY